MSPSCALTWSPDSTGPSTTISLHGSFEACSRWKGRDRGDRRGSAIFRVRRMYMMGGVSETIRLEAASICLSSLFHQYSAMSGQNGTTPVFDELNLRQPQAPSMFPHAGLRIQPDSMFIPSNTFAPQLPGEFRSHQMPWSQPSIGATTSWASQPQQPPAQPLMSPPTTGSWLLRFPRRLGFAFKSQDTDTCWRCKDCHKKVGRFPHDRVK